MRRAFLILLDILLINFAFFCAIAFHFDFRVSQVDLIYSEPILGYAVIHTAITLIIFFAFRLYHRLWKYARIEEMTNIIYACTTTEIVYFVGMRIYMRSTGYTNPMPGAFGH